MGGIDPAAVWGVPLYLERDAGLPDLGASPLGPVPLTREATDAIMACPNDAAVAELHAYARSYMGVAGSALVGAIATVACGLTGRRLATAVAASMTVISGSLVLEARRRARQWEAVADARLTSGPPRA